MSNHAFTLAKILSRKLPRALQAEPTTNNVQGG